MRQPSNQGSNHPWPDEAGPHGAQIRARTRASQGVYAVEILISTFNRNKKSFIFPTKTPPHGSPERWWTGLVSAWPLGKCLHIVRTVVSIFAHPPNTLGPHC